MRITDATLQIASLVGQAISDAGLAPVGEVGLYHGVPPADCCPKPGDPARIIGWWEILGGPPTFGKAPTIGKVSGCPKLDLVQINVVMRACWPVAQTEADAVSPPLSMFADPAVYLADCGEVGWVALTRWLCEGGFRRDPGQTIRAAHLSPVTPEPAYGGCAGIRWAVTAELRPST